MEEVVFSVNNYDLILFVTESLAPFCICFNKYVLTLSIYTSMATSPVFYSSCTWYCLYGSFWEHLSNLLSYQSQLIWS